MFRGMFDGFVKMLWAMAITIGVLVVIVVVLAGLLIMKACSL